jgi:hypothetical protein
MDGEIAAIPKQHDWCRAAFYRTSTRDIEGKVVFLTNDSRLGRLGNPFCADCGSAYPAPGACTPPIEIDALDALIDKASTMLTEPVFTPLVGARVQKLGSA